jgi:hypothetical protein
MKRIGQLFDIVDRVTAPLKMLGVVVLYVKLALGAVIVFFVVATGYALWSWIT